MRVETAALQDFGGHTHNHDYYQFHRFLQPEDTELWQKWLRRCRHSSWDFFDGMLMLRRGLDGALLESFADDDEEKGAATIIHRSARRR
ncbi:unnamed protein product [Amoebophrya sp. A25]|nr:unnamed protein product [Amoebophrya sp. A25]|eukprot:GSA25T00027522001.1